MRTVVVTVVRGRAAHLSRQLEGLALSDPHADAHVVVAMADDTVEATVERSGARDTGVVHVAGTTERLEVARARNVGAQAAIDSGAELLVFLDVDCIPAPATIGRYQVAAADPAHARSLLCGPVTYLPPPEPAGYDVATLSRRVNPHPGRPIPTGEDVTVTTDYELFWSLSFAVTTPTWRRLGGFCTEYTGYGGEDTDFGQQAASANVPMCWVGGAHAFHQYHPVSDPPIEHLADIVANSIVFQRRWGWWPMGGWIDQFVDDGVVRRDPDGRPHLV